MYEAPIVAPDVLDLRAKQILSNQLLKLYLETDRAFAVLMLVQWVGAIAIACCLSPISWATTTGYTSPNVWAAILIGGAITLFPIMFVIRMPGHAATRHIIAIGQLLMSGLLIDLTGGRIETHFHIFGSLAFLAFYRDWRVLVTASLVTIADHVVCGIFWPESIFGTPLVQPWRWAEHGGWVLFTDIFLIIGVCHSLREKTDLSRRQAYGEFAAAALRDANDRLERRVAKRTAELANANDRLQADIEERREMETALRSSEARYQRIAEKVPGMVFQLLLHPNGKFDFAYVGDGVVDIFGIEPRAVRRNASLVIDAIRSGDPIGFDAAIRQSASELTPWEWKTNIIPSNGAERWILLSARPEAQANGDLVWDGQILDMTDQLAADARESQARKMASIGQLAAGIAHEINTPTQYVGDNTRFLSDAFSTMSALVADFSELVCQDSVLAQKFIEAGEAADLPYLLEEVPKTLTQTQNGIAQIARIVGAMTEFSHPGTESKTRMDINRSIESAFTVASNAWKYVATLELDFAADLPPVLCLPGQISQVWLNIIINAAHAIGDSLGADAQSRGLISVSTRQSGSWIETRITDSGTGIDSACMARIFDPFFTTKDVGRGTGQGLSIVHSVVVEQHGGTVHAESAVGHGTTFVVRLPIGVDTK